MLPSLTIECEVLTLTLANYLSSLSLVFGSSLVHRYYYCETEQYWWVFFILIGVSVVFRLVFYSLANMFIGPISCNSLLNSLNISTKAKLYRHYCACDKDLGIVGCISHNSRYMGYSVEYFGYPPEELSLKGEYS